MISLKTSPSYVVFPHSAFVPSAIHSKFLDGWVIVVVDVDVVLVVDVDVVLVVDVDVVVGFDVECVVLVVVVDVVLDMARIPHVDTRFAQSTGVRNRMEELGVAVQCTEPVASVIGTDTVVLNMPTHMDAFVCIFDGHSEMHSSDAICASDALRVYILPLNACRRRVGFVCARLHNLLCFHKRISHVGTMGERYAAAIGGKADWNWVPIATLTYCGVVIINRP